MTDKRVLFICSHNSARSQMAAALLKKIGGDDFTVASAGLEPGPLNPLAVEVMGEIGLDISGNEPQSVFELFKQGKLYTHVITVCDQAATGCPVFPGLTQRLHWPFADPTEFTGTWEEKLARTREVREAIRERIIHWLEDLDRER